MSNTSDPVRPRILDAATTLFAQYGFRRTGMADIARAAGLSRQSLYVRFRNKTEVFIALAAALKDNALASAAAAWDDRRDLAENLAATVLAKDLPLYRLLEASPHGAELLAVDADLTAAFALELDQGFAAILTSRLKALQKAGRIALADFDGPAAFGRTLAMAAVGLKHEAKSEAAYVEAVHRLCRMAARAASSPPARSDRHRPGRGR
jgi:AcrR family transcriptional regulator